MAEFGALAQPLGTVAVPILALLSALHFYWAFGGTRGLALAMPFDGERFVWRADPIGLGGFAFFMLVSALLLAGRLGWLGTLEPRALFEWGSWAVAVVFLLRAIGDFRYIGFGKKVWDTRFARLDTFAYSPLSLLIAAAAFSAALAG